MTEPNRPQPLSQREVTQLMNAVAPVWPRDATITEASSWLGPNNVRYQKLAIDVSETPKHRLWVVELSDVVSVITRPATTSELEDVIAILCDVGAVEEDIASPVSEAHYDCHRHSFELSFVPLERMIEGGVYKRWYVTYHDDQRPRRLLSYLKLNATAGSTPYQAVV
jgi:hypothetical protein